MRKALIIGGLVSMVLTMAAGLSAAEKPKVKPVIKMYDVAELLMFPRDFPGPVTGGAGAEPFYAARTSRGELTAPELVDMIKRSVRPSSWSPGAGRAIEERTGKLFVTQTSDVHVALEKRLAAIRNRAKRQLRVHGLVVTLDAKSAARLRHRPPVFTPSEVQALAKEAGRRGVLASSQMSCLNNQRVHAAELTRKRYVSKYIGSVGGVQAVSEDLFLGTVFDALPLLTFKQDAVDVELRVFFAGNARIRSVGISGRYLLPSRHVGKGQVAPGIPRKLIAYRGRLGMPEQACWALRSSVTVPLGKYALAGTFTLPPGAGSPRTAAVLVGVTRVAPKPGDKAYPSDSFDVKGRKVKYCYYDVRDLVASIPHFPGPALGRPLYVQGGGYLTTTPEPPTTALGAGVLGELVKRTIEPASWGVGMNSIEEKNGMLIVGHSPRVQERIGKFIASLRKTYKKRLDIQVLLVRTRAGSTRALPATLSAAGVKTLLGGSGRLASEARIVCYNNQRVHLLSGRQKAHLLSDPQLPRTEFSRSGLLFDVRPWLSTDGKTATLELRAGMATPVAGGKHESEQVMRCTPAVPLGKYVVAGRMPGSGSRRTPLLVVVKAEVLK